MFSGVINMSVHLGVFDVYPFGRKGDDEDHYSGDRITHGKHFVILHTTAVQSIHSLQGIQGTIVKMSQVYTRSNPTDFAEG